VECILQILARKLVESPFYLFLIAACLSFGQLTSAFTAIFFTDSFWTCLDLVEDLFSQAIFAEVVCELVQAFYPKHGNFMTARPEVIFLLVIFFRLE